MVPAGHVNPFPKQQILGSCKLKEFAGYNSKFDENGRKLNKRVENTVGRGEIACVMSNFSFSHSVFKKIALRTRSNKCLFGKELIILFNPLPHNTAF